MNIHFDNVNLSSKTGPCTFAKRLAEQFFMLGHQVSLDSFNADVSLVFIEPSGQKLANKIVQRLDGIWFKPNEFEVKNKQIKSLYKIADAVIWQSDFDKNMSTKWWGLPKTGNVINNGINTTPIEKVTIPSLLDIRSNYEKIFVCSANWHPQKRLKDNLRLFDHIRKNQFSNSCMIVLGSNPDVVVSDPHVFYTGSQSHDTCLQVYSVADWMFHLAWADHCPNVVIEALSQGTPIICSSVGGTKEIVKNYGIILNEKEYNYELSDYDNPPEIDISIIGKLPSRHDLKFEGIKESIDINNIAKKYLQVLESVA